MTRRHVGKANRMSGLDLLEPHRRGLFIGGTWREAVGGGRFPVLDPADGSTLTDVADGRAEDARAALDAAAGAQASWATRCQCSASSSKP